MTKCGTNYFSPNYIFPLLSLCHSFWQNLSFYNSLVSKCSIFFLVFLLDIASCHPDFPITSILRLTFRNINLLVLNQLPRVWKIFRQPELFHVFGVYSFSTAKILTWIFCLCLLVLKCICTELHLLILLNVIWQIAKVWWPEIILKIPYDHNNTFTPLVLPVRVLE